MRESQLSLPPHSLSGVGWHAGGNADEDTIGIHHTLLAPSATQKQQSILIITFSGCCGHLVLQKKCQHAGMQWSHDNYIHATITLQEEENVSHRGFIFLVHLLPRGCNSLCLYEPVLQDKQ